MAKTITDDPVALIMQCEINPESPPVPATREAVEILGAEIKQLDARRNNLAKAQNRLLARMTSEQA